MKKYVVYAILIMILLIGDNAHGAIICDTVPKTLSNQPDEYTQLLKKYHDQKTASTIMLIGSGALLFTGSILALSSLDHLFQAGPHYGSAPIIFLGSGLIILAAAIPIALAARKNKKKAELFMNNESMLNVAPTCRNNTLTSIGIKINL